MYMYIHVRVHCTFTFKKIFCNCALFLITLYTASEYHSMHIIHCVSYGNTYIIHQFDNTIMPVKNWEKEFSKWLGNERLLVYAVSSEHRAEVSSRYSLFLLRVNKIFQSCRQNLSRFLYIQCITLVTV